MLHISYHDGYMKKYVTVSEELCEVAEAHKTDPRLIETLRDLHISELETHDRTLGIGLNEKEGEEWSELCMRSDKAIETIQKQLKTFLEEDIIRTSDEEYFTEDRTCVLVLVPIGLGILKIDEKE